MLTGKMAEIYWLVFKKIIGLYPNIATICGIHCIFYKSSVGTGRTVLK